MLYIKKHIKKHKVVYDLFSSKLLHQFQCPTFTLHKEVEYSNIELHCQHFGNIITD